MALCLTIFPVSAFLKTATWHKLQDVDAHRQIIFDAIVQYRRMKNIGVRVAVSDRLKFDRYAHFARIGEGSLGRRAVAWLFSDNIIARHPELNQFENATALFQRRWYSVPISSTSLWTITIFGR